MAKKPETDTSPRPDPADTDEGEIPVSRFEKSEFDNLDDYLDDDFNYEIYLSEKRSQPEEYPLDDQYYISLFKSFYRVLSFLRANLDRPLAVETKVREEFGSNSLRRALFSYADQLATSALRESRALAHQREIQRELEEKTRFHVTELYKSYRISEDADDDTEAGSGQNEFDPAKRGLTRQLAMLLVDELFPNLKYSSNTAKGELLSLLTGWNAAGLRNKWSDYRRGNPESLKADMEKVAEWKKKLKIREPQK